MKKNLLILMLLFSSLLLNSHLTVSAQEDVASRDTTSTTSKGTSISIYSELEHDPLDDNTPVLNINQSYELLVVIQLNELGGDARDFHDVEIEVDLSTSSILGSGKTLFSAYHFDSATKFTEAGQNRSYTFNVLITGQVPDTDGTLKVSVSGKEDVENKIDPSSTFDDVAYDVKITGTGAFDSSLIGGSEVTTRSSEVLTEEGTKLGIEVNMTHEGDVDAKPSINSGVIYPVSVGIEIIELGADPEDYHDLELYVVMEDTSITNYIPGNDAVRYYSGYSSHDGALVVGDEVNFQLYVIANTNLNATEVDFKFTIKGREKIDGFTSDPKSEFHITVETKLNNDLSNSSLGSDDEEVPIHYLFGFIAMLCIVPITSRKRRSF